MKVLRPAVLRVISLLVIVYSLVGTIGAPNPMASSATPDQAASRSISHTDVNPLGAAFFLDREVETWKKEHTFRMASEAGIGWVRQLFPWEGLEPTKKGRFWDEPNRKSTWDKFDELVDMARRYDLRFIARLDRPPDWARHSSDIPNNLPVNPDDFGDFVYAVVNHFKGRVQYYQIWNEPNLAVEWAGRPVDAAGYTTLLQVAYKRAKEADPNAVILSAPLAQTLETGPANLNEFDYLEKMYAAGAGQYFDILSANAYGFDRPPNDPPAKDTLNFQRVTLLREIMVKHDDGKKAIWLNEFGWNASPENFPKDKLYWQRVSEQQQAAYTVEAIQLSRSWDWMGVIGIWYFRQVGDYLAADSTYFFRIVDVDFTPRLVYFAVQKLSPKFLIGEAGTHEETHGAVKSKDAWASILDPAASDGSYLLSTRPGDTLEITFVGTGLTLTYPKGPAWGRAALLVDGAPAHGLARDRDGQTTLDFVAPALTQGVTTKITSGLPQGKHVLQLKVLAGASPTQKAIGATLDSFTIENQAPGYERFYWSAGLLVVGIAGLGYTFIRRRSR